MPQFARARPTKRETTTTSWMPVWLLIASSSAYFARSGGASAVAVAARREKTERKVRKRYGFVSRQRTPSRRRVEFHDQSSTFVSGAAGPPQWTRIRPPPPRPHVPRRR